MVRLRRAKARKYIVVWWGWKRWAWGWQAAVHPWSLVYEWFFDIGPVEVRKTQQRKLRGRAGGKG